MKNNFSAFISSLVLALFLIGCNTQTPKCPSCDLVIPDGIKTDPGIEIYAFSLTAKGYQIYECRVDTTDPERKSKWILKAPEAELFDEKGQLVGSHGKGPHWTATLKNDNSSVVGIKVLSRVDSPSKGAIQWLLVEANGSGEGMFGNVTKIQRVDTNGGRAPEACCDATGCCTEVRVPYTATYYFYRPNK